MLAPNKNNLNDIVGRGPIHPFPARMSPGIALGLLSDSNPRLRVLDPMAGSGTVLAVARSRGHRSIGVDLDPLAVLMTRVWTRAINRTAIIERARSILDKAKSKFKNTSIADSYPRRVDEDTKRFIRYWFDPYVRRQLTALSHSIAKVHDYPTRDALWCAFSRLIISKQAGASLAMDLSHSRPHRTFGRAPIKPFDKFLSAVNIVVSNCPEKGSKAIGPATTVTHGDARNLQIKDCSIDLVLTSPPYLNAIDYMRCSKFSLVWMGYNTDELQRIRGESIGAERRSAEALRSGWVEPLINRLRLRPKLSDTCYAMLARYVWDMDKALREATRVLRHGGRAVYVVGNSTMRGTFIRNSSIVKGLGLGCGLDLLSEQTRTIPANRRYLPPPPPRRKQADQIGSRLRQEIVLTFAKP